LGSTHEAESNIVVEPILVKSSNDMLSHQTLRAFANEGAHFIEFPESRKTELSSRVHWIQNRTNQSFENKKHAVIGTLA